MAVRFRVALAATALHGICAQQVETARFTVETTREAQVILGIGYEIQSDSIGSGNNGLPTSNTSVPNDLIQSEKDRFFTDMLAGFRYCRLALGLYFRGLTADQKNVVERWPGQAAGLAEMATKSGIEGFAAEYWSPPPGWKDTGNYIGGHLIGVDNATLSSFGDAVVTDADYLEGQGMPLVWWGLQNEPPVGESGSCSYSCCGYNASQYYAAFKATASKIRSALPKVVVHASSWSGQYYSPQISQDPEALDLVDVWTFHRVGADSSDQITNQAYFLSGAGGRPVMNNEYEYLDNQDSPERTINTAQSLMNWMVFENSPVWYWLHALKPLGHAEAAGYGLGYWQPWVNSSSEGSDGTVADATAVSSSQGTVDGRDGDIGHAATSHASMAAAGTSASPAQPGDNPPSIPPGTWEYNPLNWNSLAGFTRYMPWDSVRINVTEEELRQNVRVLAYRYNPAKARWLDVDGQPLSARSDGAAVPRLRVPARPARGSTAKVIRGHDAQERAEATKLAFVVTNRYNTTTMQVMVSWAGLSELRPQQTAAPLPTFTGHLFQPNVTDSALGTIQTQLNATTGLPYFVATLQPYSIQFWVED